MAITASIIGGYINAAKEATVAAAAAPAGSPVQIPSIWDALKPTNYSIGGGILVFVVSFAGILGAQYLLGVCGGEKYVKFKVDDWPLGVRPDHSGGVIYSQMIGRTLSGSTFRGVLSASGDDKVDLILDPGKTTHLVKCNIKIILYDKDRNLSSHCKEAIRIPENGVSVSLAEEFRNLASKARSRTAVSADDRDAIAELKSAIDTDVESLKSCFHGLPEKTQTLYVLISPSQYCPPSETPPSAQPAHRFGLFSLLGLLAQAQDHPPPPSFNSIKEMLALDVPGPRDEAVAALIQNFGTYQESILTALIQEDMPMAVASGLFRALSSVDISKNWAFGEYRDLAKPIPLPVQYRTDFIRALVTRYARNPDPDIRAEVRRFLRRYPADEVRAGYEESLAGSGNLSDDEQNALGQAGVSLYAARIANYVKLPASKLRIEVLRGAQRDYERKEAVVSLLNDRTRVSAALMGFVWADLVRFAEKYMVSYPDNTFTPSATIAKQFLDEARAGSYASIDHIAYGVFFAHVKPSTDLEKGLKIRSDLEKGQWFAREKIALDPVKYDLPDQNAFLKTGPGAAYPPLDVRVRKNDKVTRLMQSGEWIFVDTGAAYGWVKKAAQSASG